MSAALPRARQQGVVLFIALIVLVAMSLAGIAMMRSVSTGALIANNLAFKQSATLSADAGIEAARAWLIANSGSTLDNDTPSVTGGSAYYANWGLPDTQFGEDPTKSSYNWSTAASVGTDAAGNTVSYVIQRLCPLSGFSPTAQQCIKVNGTSGGTTGGASGTKGAAGYGGYALTIPANTVYRVTVQVKGPRNTISYVQATVF